MRILIPNLFLVLTLNVYFIKALADTKELRRTCAVVKLANVTSDIILNPCDRSLEDIKVKGLIINSSISEAEKTENITQLLQTTFANCNTTSHSLFSFKVSLGCTLKFCDRNLKENCTNVTNLMEIGKLDISEIYLTYTDISKSSISCTCEDTTELIKSTNWNGVIFSAYDKYAEPCSNHSTRTNCPVTWWNYTKADIIPQLEIITSRFNQISTYGMGTVEYYLDDQNRVKDWKESVVPSALIPIWVAEINKAAGYLRLQVVIGIFQLPDYTIEWVGNETRNAILATKESNSIFPASIWAISVQINFYPEALLNGFKRDVEILQKVKKEFPDQEIKVGLRIIDCEKTLVENVRSEDISKLYCRENDKICKSELPSALLPNVTDLAKNSDFVICFIRPSADLFANNNKNTTMETVVQQTGKKLLEIKSAFLKVNKNIEIIGETGWASQGRSSNGSPNTLKNLRDYWTQIAKWGELNNFKFYMFEAFNEPWKNNDELKDKKHPGGICGSEAYYGWWKRANNSQPAIYIQKINEIPYSLQTKSDTGFIEAAKVPPECLVDFPNNPESSEGGWGTGNLILLIGISLTLLTTFILIVTYMGHRLRMAKSSQIMLSQKYLEMFNKGLSPDELHDQGDYNVIALQFPYDRKKYELPKGSFHIDQSKFIGKGQSGTVYIGQIKGLSEDIAFKTTNSASTIIDIKNILSEIKILSYIGKHENVVCILGAYTEELNKGMVSLALEYCQLGSLETVLRRYYQPHSCPTNYSTLQMPSNSYVTTAVLTEPMTEIPLINNEELDISLLPKWAFQIANGMEYLANKRVVHADLAARNILLTQDKIIKITDFGLSRKLYHEIGQTLDPEVPLPWRWMAPESLRHLTFCTATDIWSYGITLWEIYSLGEVPYPGITFNNQFILDLENGVKMTAPKYASSEMYEILCKCWNLHSNLRPSFTQLKTDLQNFIT